MSPVVVCLGVCMGPLEASAEEEVLPFAEESVTVQDDETDPEDGKLIFDYDDAVSDFDDELFSCMSRNVKAS